MPWVCPSCSAETELGYNVCTNCHTPRPGSETGPGDFELGADNPIRIVIDGVAYITFLIVAELLIPYTMFRFLGVPPDLGVIVVLVVFGLIVYILSRRHASTNPDSNG